MSEAGIFSDSDCAVASHPRLEAHLREECAFNEGAVARCVVVAFVPGLPGGSATTSAQGQLLWWSASTCYRVYVWH